MTDADEAADSLAQAVRDKMVCYDSVILSAVNSTKSKKEPSQVAFLALAVFAASRMNSEGSVSFRDYYIRLNEVLFDKSDQGAPQGFDRHCFEELWMDLQSWVKHEYDLNLYLTKGPRNGWCVWYPKSQCLITKHEQRAIYLFFRSNKLTPFSDLSEHDLERRLRYWMFSSTCPNKIGRYLSHEIYKKAILRQVISLLRNWDREIPPKLPSHGRQATIPIDIEFRFKQFDGPEIRYWFRKRGAEEVACEANRLRIKRLRLLPSSKKWFRSEIDNTSTFWNRSSLDRLQLRTNEVNPVVYTLGLSNIWVFREDPERDNGWLSQRNMQLHEDHLVVFSKKFVKQVMDCLRKTCEHKIETPNHIYVGQKPNGWFYLRAIPTTLKRVDDPDLWKLSVDSNKQICFVGGLSVKGEDGHGTYLDICLPSVSLPDIGNSEDLLLLVDDQSIPVGENRFVRLENKLGVGIHQLSYGKKTRKLRVTAPDRSLKHQEKTLTAALSEDQETIPTYFIETTAEIVEKPGLWLAGTKFFGINIPQVSWKDVKKTPKPPPSDPFFKTPANIISSVIKVAIDFKRENTSVPEWFDEALEYLDQNVALRSLVEKKLNHYYETALSYVELRKQIGK